MKAQDVLTRFDRAASARRPHMPWIGHGCGPFAIRPATGPLVNWSQSEIGVTGFPPDLYAGTAEYYEQFRPRYPEFMLAELRERVGRLGTLLDLACGPGQIAIPMAPFFDRVLAVDLEPDMVEVGRAAAGRAGLANIEWRVGRAEDLVVTSGSRDVLTIGSAFHRLDRKLIATRARQWLRRAAR